MIVIVINLLFLNCCKSRLTRQVIMLETPSVDSSSSPSLQLLFKTLISAFQSSEELKPILRSLYCFLIHVSLDYESPNYVAKSACFDQSELNCEDAQILANMLFEELSKSLLLNLVDIGGQADSDFNMQSQQEELILLLRCCMVTVNLLVPDQILVEKSQVLLGILRKLCSPHIVNRKEKNAVRFETSVSSQAMHTNEGCTTSLSEDFNATLWFFEPYDSRMLFLRQMLEVFLDELLANRPLRKYIMMSEFVSHTRNMFMCWATDIGGILEVISAHFLVSVSGIQAFEGFIKNLILVHKQNRISPEVSLSAAVSLLMNPVMITAPSLVHAHVISLVSEVINTSITDEYTAATLRYVHFYLSSFEKSVILYHRHMSHLQIYDLSVDANGSFAKSPLQPSFELHIHSLTKNRISLVLTELDNLWDSHVCKIFTKPKASMMTTSIDYMKENINLLHESFRDETFSFLTFIVMRALSTETGDIVLQQNGLMSLQDICLLASILKLMSCSMLQAIHCMRRTRDSYHSKTSRVDSSLTEYDFIVGLIYSFGKYKIQLSIQELLVDAMEDHMSTHTGLKLMFVHFTGLLSLCLASGLDFVVKGCLSIMMVLMNLLVLEEGNLDFLGRVLSLRLKSHSPGVSLGSVTKYTTNYAVEESLGNIDKGYRQRISSRIVASKFEKIQMLYLSMGAQDKAAKASENDLILTDRTRHVIGMEEESQETCNGEVFLRCMVGEEEDDMEIHPEESIESSWNLVYSPQGGLDMSERKRKKIILPWLRDRERYRKWKHEKIAILRWEKKTASTWTWTKA
ncbi:hypothetical protein Nepgr_023584 [Nepenthes gracilis]|uniref:DUF7812 domain-containing protein n=1 Tax=Nepenthes gracilis TaxID=150966 RepID=A0AAD3T2T1_NEPGR|nr:hypothetical protein Nepgr_023584 [Nepenthes gracilis]